MRNPVSPHPLLAAVALAGLLAYVLACTSFSPDDTRVAFPAFDARSGELGISVLDRKSGRVETVFTFSKISNLERPKHSPGILHGQWLDNKRLLICWPPSDDALSVLVLPVGGGGAARLWEVQGIQRAEEKMSQPPALAGTRLFLVAESNVVVRLDLETGRVVSHSCRGENLRVYPAGRDDSVFYAATVDDRKGKMEFGRLNAADFAQTPLLEMEDASVDRVWRLAFSADGRQVALVGHEGSRCEIRLARAGQAARTLSIPTGEEKLHLGGLCFSPKGDTLYASFVRDPGKDLNKSCGLLEIPVDGGAVSRTVLFTGPEKMEADYTVYLQPGISHDGRTVALCSTYLFAEVEMAEARKAQSACALFLVDVSKRPHGVSRIPLALPKEDRPFK